MAGSRAGHETPMNVLDRVRLDYRAAFLGYLGHRKEGPLHSGYELGRSALSKGVSLLQITHLHHEMLLEALEQSSSEDVVATATAASDFLLEVLATYDMTQRSFLDRNGAPDPST